MFLETKGTRPDKELCLTMKTSISVEEVSKHNRLEDLWIVVNGIVYDLTEFASEHPGGVESMFFVPSSPQRQRLLTIISHPPLCRPRRNSLLLRNPRSISNQNLPATVKTPRDPRYIYHLSLLRQGQATTVTYASSIRQAFPRYSNQYVRFRSCRFSNTHPESMGVLFQRRDGLAHQTAE